MHVLLNAGSLSPDDPRLAAAAPGAQFTAISSEDEMHAAAPTAEVCWGARWLDVLLADAPRLRWVASGSAGVEGLLARLAARPEVVLTTGAGAFDVPIAEHVLALLLALRRGLHHSLRAQAEGRWARQSGLDELHGSTLAVIGLGHIGRELARQAHAGFGLRILAYRREPVPAPAPVERVYSGRDGLLAMLAAADAVAVTCALTPETRGLLDAEALDALRPHALVVNIARGAVIDQAALVARLADGRLAGAGLDVTDPEPPAADDPLWGLDNVIITPHVAGNSRRTGERQAELFLANLTRYATGQPLLNLVDAERGY